MTRRILILLMILSPGVIAYASIVARYCAPSLPGSGDAHPSIPDPDGRIAQAGSAE